MAEIEGMASLRARLGRMRAHAENPEPALDWAGGIVAGAAMARIDAGGPGWPANKTHTPLLHKTGRLLRSLEPQNSVHVAGDTATISTNVEYAVWLQDGTGVFAGRSSYQTRHATKLASMLGAAGIKRSVTHQGIPPRRFLIIDDKVSAIVERGFARYFAGDSIPGGPS